jgi:MoaA/NifB/PqqE/SkfB family radical SAM enzyme
METTIYNHPTESNPATIKNGLSKKVVEIQILLSIVRVIVSNTKNPFAIIKVFAKLLKIRKKMLGTKKLTKIVKSGSRYFWDMHSPGWPSPAFKNFYQDELERIISPHQKHHPAKLVVFSITNKCPLRCEHCYEADNLGKNEELSLDQIKLCLLRLQQNGLTKVGISGGEPMTRLDDVLDFVQAYHTTIDFWLLTSGYNVTEENARRLKNAGLTGLSISADHFEPKKHNQFRRNSHAFSWMQNAVANGNKAGLLICLTICATNQFISPENLAAYAEMAKSMGVSFIQLVEPRSMGAYANKDVTLTHESIAHLERFFIKMNYDARYSSYPIVAYNAYHQRRLGCMGNANRYFFIDTTGNIHPCHFCRKNMGSILDPDYNMTIDKLRNFQGCNAYTRASEGFVFGAKGNLLPASV